MEESKPAPQPRRAAIQLLIGIILGLCIGGTAVVLAMRRSEPAPRTTSVQAPPAIEKGTPLVADAGKNVKPPEPRAQGIPPEIKAPDKKDEAKTPAKPTGPTPTPLNPLSGTISMSPMTEKDLPVGAPARIEETKPSVRLLEVSLPETQDGAIRTLASKAGGRAREITDYRGESFTPMPALLILVAPEKTQGIVEALTKLGSVPGDDWHGPPADRDDVLSQRARSALRDLRQKRQDLVARYFEDAAQVQDVDAKIAAVSASIAKMRSKSDRSDAIKVLLTPN